MAALFCFFLRWKAGLEESKAAQKILEEREQEASPPQSQSRLADKASSFCVVRSALAKSKSKAFEARLMGDPERVGDLAWCKGPACPHSPAGGLAAPCDATPRPRCDTAKRYPPRRSEDERDKAKAEMQLAKRGCQEAEEAPGAYER